MGVMKMELKMNMKTGLIATTLALALGGAACGQGGGFPPPPGMGGGPGMGGPGMMGGPGVIFGKVKSVDTTAKTIKLIEARRGRICTVHVEDDATIRAEKTVSASDLKVGDEIAVRGIPTGISASSIIDGDPREAMPPPPGGGPDDDMGDGPEGDGPQGDGPDRHGPPSMASASGKVTSVSPLTIQIGDDVSVVIKTASTARVHKIVSEQLSDIKAGDRILASGDPDDDGHLDVDKIAVNVHMPPPPPGMGRRQGPRGFGGQDMGDNGPGGFGQGGPGQGGPQFGGRPPQGGPDGGGDFQPGMGGGGPDGDGPGGDGPPPPPGDSQS